MRAEPVGQFDRNAWAAKVALLAEDVAHVPIDLLQAAIQQHVASSPYLPKASDLIALAKAEVAGVVGGMSIEEYVDTLNSKPFVRNYGWEYFVEEYDDGRKGLGKRERAVA